MMSEIRNFRFTSSEIYRLASVGNREMTADELTAHRKEFPKSHKKFIKDGYGESFYTYVDEVNMQREFGRSLDMEINTKPITWGYCIEGYINSRREILGLEYEYCSQQTIQHPTIDCLAGSPDNRKYGDGDTVCDSKAPSSLKSFYNLVKPLYDGFTGMDAMNKIRDTHPDGEKFYFQLVNNSILTNSRWAELIVFVPYKSELQAIREYAEGDKRFYWIWAAEDRELPYLIDDGKFNNKNVIRFEVPQSDKDFLLSRIEAASKLLIPI